MAMTRRQLIQGALAAMAAAVTLRPRLPGPGDAAPRPTEYLWWLNNKGLRFSYTDRPDYFCYGYIDYARQWQYFYGENARREMARQATLHGQKPLVSPRFLQQVQS